MKFGLRRELTLRFVIVDVDLHIIGVELLSHNGHLVDCRNNRLHGGVASLSSPGLIAPLLVPSVKVIAGGMATESLLEQFPGLNKPAGSDRKSSKTKSFTSAQQPTTCSLPHTPSGTRPLGCSQSRVRHHAAGRNRQTRRGPVVVVSCRKSTIRGPELLTLRPSRTGIQSHTYRTTATAFQDALLFRRLTG
jgi:hypothetical protein